MSVKKTERTIISDKLSIEKTGQALEAWYTELDKLGAKKLSHKEIFAIVSSIKGLKPLRQWNQNLLTTSYEWSRGLKERGQKGEKKDFEISVSKTMLVPLPVLYTSLVDEKTRKKWLKEKITIRKATENKSARITWSDNVTSLSVDFYSKGKDKSQIVVQHQKIGDSKQATELKEYWSEKLNELKSLLEK